MNEPHDMATTLVLKNDQVQYFSFPLSFLLFIVHLQAAINGIRSAGARQLILAPGNGFTGGHSWTQPTGANGDQPSSEVLFKLVDPLKNLAIEVHEVSCLQSIRHMLGADGSYVVSR